MYRCFQRGRLASGLTDEALTHVGGFGLKKIKEDLSGRKEVSGRNYKNKFILKNTQNSSKRPGVIVWSPEVCCTSYK